MSEQNQSSKNKAATNSSPTNASSTSSEVPKWLRGSRADQSSAWKKLLSKKWVFPALYMTAAALILTLVWVYQDKNQLVDSGRQDAHVSQQVGSEVGVENPVKDEATEVVAVPETLGWPVADAHEVDVVMPFYDDKASKEEQASAIVEYNQTFTPNVGIDLARKDQKSFTVLAAMDGKVTRAEPHPQTGFVVEIDHHNGLKTVYQSLVDPKVNKGDLVKKGDALATAGRNELEKKLGVHMHFEVHEANQPVNPTMLLTPKS